MGEQSTKRLTRVEDETANGAWHRFLDVMLAHKEQFAAGLAKFDLNPASKRFYSARLPLAQRCRCATSPALSPAMRRTSRTSSTGWKREDSLSVSLIRPIAASETSC